MAVAVKKASVLPDGSRPEGKPGWTLPALSLAGTLYAVLAFAFVYYTIPWLWATYIVPARLPANLYTSGLQMLLMAVAAVGSVAVWRLLVPQAPHGLRAGIFVGLVFAGGGLLLVYGLALLAERLLPGPIAPALTLGVALALLVFLWRTFHKETFQDRLRVIEDQGWFTAKGFKKGQGFRLRTGTVLGIMTIVATGLWVFTRGQNILAGEQLLSLPFGLGDVVVLRAPVFVVAVVGGVLAAWFAYRLVNYPRFADFLIATEAEMNKVSWSSRRRLVQDTIVVLVTVAFLTGFLFVMDIIWWFLLRAIGVLHT